MILIFDARLIFIWLEGGRGLFDSLIFDLDLPLDPDFIYIWVVSGE